MSKFSTWFRSFVGGLIALTGACLVGWQAVLGYYIIIGRVKAGEAHPPLIVIASLLAIGVLLIVAGYIFSRPVYAGSKTHVDK